MKLPWIGKLDRFSSYRNLRLQTKKITTYINNIPIFERASHMCKSVRLTIVSIRLLRTQSLCRISIKKICGFFTQLLQFVSTHFIVFFYFFFFHLNIIVTLLNDIIVVFFRYVYFLGSISGVALLNTNLPTLVCQVKIYITVPLRFIWIGIVSR